MVGIQLTSSKSEKTQKHGKGPGSYIENWRTETKNHRNMTPRTQRVKVSG